MSKKLLPSQLDSVRKQLVVRQGGKCAICGHPFTTRDGPVLDHDHDTGFIRGVLHRSCNSAEGRVKTKAHLGHTGVRAYDYLIGLGAYLAHHKIPKLAAIHPTHQTDQEKRVATNKKAKIRRKAKKATTASIEAAEANKAKVRAPARRRKKA